MSGELAALGRNDDRARRQRSRWRRCPDERYSCNKPGRGPRQPTLLQRADALRERIGGERFRDELVATLYRRAEESRGAVRCAGGSRAFG